jgi:hypothetical protein
VPIEDEVLCYEPRVDVLTCAGYAYFTTVSLIEADPEYAANLTTERLVAFVETNPDYDIPVTEVGGQRMLRFDPSPQHRHQIPKLLADDYLHSQLTNRNYEAGSKHRVQA